MLYVSEGLQGVAKPSTLLLTGPQKKMDANFRGKMFKAIVCALYKTQVFRVVLP